MRRLNGDPGGHPAKLPPGSYHGQRKRSRIQSEVGIVPIGPIDDELVKLVWSFYLAHRCLSTCEQCNRMREFLAANGATEATF